MDFILKEMRVEIHTVDPDTKELYNPEKKNIRHGDLPPRYWANDGTAWMEIYTGRFYPMDVCRQDDHAS